MAAVLHTQTESEPVSPSTLRPQASPSPISPNVPALPPLVTSPPLRQPSGHRGSTFAAKSRLSTYSNASNAFSRSRPQSHVFPLFHSSLSYSLVRDFSYPPYHPLHYGPPPESASGISTPATEANRRLSDPQPAWEKGSWSAGSWDPNEQLPTTSFADGDGPPWSEDDDLASPVVTSSRHRKQKSNMVGFDESRGRTREIQRGRRGSYAGTNGDGSETYYVSDDDEGANGPGGEYITYPGSRSSRYLDVARAASADSERRDSHFQTLLPNRAYASQSTQRFNDADEELSSSPESADDDEIYDVDESRYSRDYQFTIASPDEEMHGKAVALFDFARENENELPLVEGQVILVSYRHGQGWLVAQDPKTGESGLVPEEYVRLLRDIKGGWNGLMNGQLEAQEAVQGQSEGIETMQDPSSTDDLARTPTQAEHGNKQTLSGEYYPPVVSTFSTSRDDLQPWPHKEMLGSQANTPTLGGEFPHSPRSSEDRRSPDRPSIEEDESSDTLKENLTPTKASKH
ncbi:hypothetical protein K402DRAFT_417924 [Aulographum hederae CBS 113979]|uniref:SH3 domain-containing protein n=1 Tax=Aulographum hederae CBS 113979 TaxID=1176131 RepID=A0A6G1HB97_9PEZI|nr:hypothetical protein K402DRAFT_417924 [Aulographum hederae CBS 113979]